jgi:hypothetical protein
MFAMGYLFNNHFHSLRTSNFMTLTKTFSIAAISTMTAVTASAIFAPVSQAASLGTYTFTGNNSVNRTATGVAPGLTFSSFGTGSGLDGVANGGTFITDDWNNGINDFLTFGITPGANTRFSLTSIALNAAREVNSGTTAPIGLSLRSSLDNFATVIGTVSVGTSISASPLVFNLSSAFTNLSSGVTFRIFGTGATSVNRTLSVDNVVINGAVTAIPTPALLPGLVALGVGAWRKRQGEESESA